MIKRQVDAVVEKVKRQAVYIWKGKRRNKGQFIESFADKIESSVPEVSREDINIITSGFLAELRSIDRAIVMDLIHDGK